MRIALLRGRERGVRGGMVVAGVAGVPGEGWGDGGVGGMMRGMGGMFCLRRWFGGCVRALK